MTVTAATVEWLNIGKEYVPETRREKFLAAVEKQEWKDPIGDHPMMPAMGLRAVILEFGITPVMAISYNVAWECPDGTEGTATYTVLGIKTRLQRLLFIDTGCGVTPAAILPA